MFFKHIAHTFLTAEHSSHITERLLFKIDPQFKHFFSKKIKANLEQFLQNIIL